jgi:hypothetical protein
VNTEIENGCFKKKAVEQKLKIVEELEKQLRLA